jgi:predicted ATPase
MDIGPLTLLLRCALALDHEWWWGTVPSDPLSCVGATPHGPPAPMQAASGGSGSLLARGEHIPLTLEAVESMTYIRGDMETSPEPRAEPGTVGGSQSAERSAQRVGVPEGEVTFLFTDVEGSTVLLEQNPDAFEIAMQRHHDVLREAVESSGGLVFETVGDAVYAAFDRVDNALAAAISGQLALEAEAARSPSPIRCRMAISTGHVKRLGSHYFGVPLFRTARILALGHGGQTLVSSASMARLAGPVPNRGSLTDRGRYRLKDLAESEHLYELRHPDLPVVDRPLRSLDQRLHNLPPAQRGLIGRHEELRRLRSLIPETRLVSLTGPGGAGKTALAIEAARDVLGEFGDGVFFIDLAPVRNQNGMVSAIATTLEVRESGRDGLEKVLVSHLREKHVLLVVDNFEQVLSAAPWIAQLCDRCPLVHLLITSRASLSLRIELEFPVGPLAVSANEGQQPAASPAVQLFLDRMRVSAVDIGDDLERVALICTRLDGLPLAIELAAARAKVLGIGGLLRRLSEGTDVLGRGRSDLPERQRTLASTIRWSYDLLRDEEREGFQDLSVFVGSFSLDVAEALLAELGSEHALDVLSALLDNSLILRDPGPGDRLRMLETVRDFARAELERSGRARDARRHHASHFLALAEDVGARIREPGQLYRAIAEIARDRYNILAAVEAMLLDDDARAGRLVAGVWLYWHEAGLWSEGTDLLDRVINSVPVAGSDRALLLEGLGNLTWRVDLRSGATRLQEALATFAAKADHVAESRVLATLSLVAYHRGDPRQQAALARQAVEAARRSGKDVVVARALRAVAMGAVPSEEARAALRESQAIAQRLGDSHTLAQSLAILAGIEVEAGDYVGARSAVDRGLALADERGDRTDLAYFLFYRGVIERSTGDLGAARDTLGTSLTEWKTIGDRVGELATTLELGVLAVAMGDLEDARSKLTSSLEMALSMGDIPNAIEAVEGLAMLAAAEGHARTAVRLWAMADQARGASGLERMEPHQSAREQELAKLRRSVGEAEWRLAEASARDLTLSGVLDVIRTERLA